MKTAKSRKGCIDNPNLTYEAEPREVKLRKIISGETSNMDDLHKPALDQIGFQELITEQMAWWNTHWDMTSSIWAIS